LARIPVDKKFFDLRGGLNTEASPLSFPDNTTSDESNLEILIDGTRRRRKGINPERDETSTQIPAATVDYDAGDSFNSFTWYNVGTISDLVYIVVQIGSELHFYRDSGTTISNQKHPFTVDLGNYVTEPEDPTNVFTTPVTFAYGDGRLYVAHPRMESLQVTYVSDTEAFVVQPIFVQVREFEDIEDGIPLYERPAHDTSGDTTTRPGGVLGNDDIPNSHEYNLINRGWIVDDPDTGAERVAIDNGYWPPKNYIPWYGYVAWEDPGLTVRASGDVGWNTLSHYKDWDTEKLDGEDWFNADAPKGSLVINPWNNTGVQSSTLQNEVGGCNINGTNTNPTPGYEGSAIIDGFAATDPTTEVRVLFTIIGDHSSKLIGERINAKSLGIAGYEGSAFISYRRTCYFNYVTLTLETVPTYDVGTNTSQFYADVPFTYKGKNISSSINAYSGTLVGDNKSYASSGLLGPLFYKSYKGIFQAGSIFINENPSITTRRPACLSWYAGRLFYAGVDDSRWSDTVFFSRVVEQKDDIGYCFQRNDPTHPEQNALYPADGGTIQIPNVGNIKALHSMDASLLVFSDQGVWEISGANYFAADDIIVRQIDNSDVIVPKGITSIDEGLVYLSSRGVHLLARDQYGRIVTQNISETTIQSLWDQLSDAEKKAAFLAYNENRNQVYLCHSYNDPSGDPTIINRILILDMRIGAWYKWDIGASALASIRLVHPIKEATSTNERNKMKYFVLSSAFSVLTVADQSQESFLDFNLEEAMPYLETGYDNLGDFSTQRTAPTIHVYSFNTVTGYGVDGPINDSSILLQSKWSFSNKEDSNKWSAKKQVHRRREVELPASATDTPPFELVHTKNRQRGRGDALQLRFEGESGKDFHLAGWAIEYMGAK
jgi:hypothetical protein